MVDMAERVCSVMLAILIARLLGGANISWAAFAGYMVIAGTISNTLLRGMLRLVGTVAGGLLALVLAPRIGTGVGAIAAALFVVASISIYAATTSRRAYAWLFFGLTFAMVVLDYRFNRQLSLDAFVETRMLETIAGILASISVSLFWTYTLRDKWPPIAPAPPPPGGWHPDALRHAIQCGIALALLTLAVGRFGLPGPAQAAVTIMASMLIPVQAMARSGLRPVSTRLVQRVLGCVLGGVFAGSCLLLMRGSMPLLLAATAVAVALGRMLETGPAKWRYVGTQFVLAALVTLVPDDYAHAASTPAWERLAGIFIGTAFLVPVLLAWHLVAGGRPPQALPVEQGMIDPLE